jgi:NADP-dependent 3-hydroxy acid dehydrogenase YdfG
MAVEDVAKAVFHMADLPPEANVQSMMIMASKMPHIGRG